jgi:transposase
MLSRFMNRFKVYGPYKRTMAQNRTVYSETKSPAGKIGTTTARPASSPQRYPLDFTDRGTLGRFARTVSTQKHLPSALPGVDRIRGLRQDSDRVSQRPERAWRYRLERRFYRWNICSGKKRGDGVGKTKRGKGTKIMGLTDAGGLPIAVDATSASPHEITLVDDTLDACFLENVPEKVIGDKAYDSDTLDKRLAKERNVEMIAPHKSNRCKQSTQDGRTLRRYRKRWKVERFFAWLQNFRRLVVRYEYHLENFLAMIQLGCIVILLRRVLG